uniref:CBM21 domain-containing protein n=1 Tax=Dicentrarchus labrax TaxID=13489 RepID=A0A8C4ICM1_DICLA
MLNVSCQKQKQCSSLPADSFTERVPGLSILDLDLDDDEGEVVIGIRPKSSPLPRRKSSISDEELDPEPPLCGSRRVSFADSKGLSLVQVKEFGTWDVPKLPGYDSSESECKDEEEYFLSPFTFSLPLSTEELFVNVRDQKVELETIEVLPGTTILRGVIRVLNISFTKAVYVRTTLDTWSTHFDLLAEYIPGSSDNLTDCFSFKLTLVPPFGEQGARVDFCLRYETPVGTFWANNNDRNYVLFCHQRVKERKEKQEKEIVNKKSCLKIVFGRLGSESQSVGDWGNPVWGALNVGDLTQSYPCTERRETSCIVLKDTGGNNDKVQTNVKTQESNQECLDATSNHPPIEETGLTVTANHIQDHAETLEEIKHSDKRCTNTSDVPETVSGDTVVHAVNILNTDLLDPQIPNESLHLQGEAQEDNLTHDLTHDSSQTTAETAWAQLPEHTCIQIKPNLDETCAQSETQEVMTGPETTFMSLNDFECVDEPKKDNEVDKTVTVSTINAFSEEDKLLEPLHDLIPNYTSSSDSKETGNTNVTCFKIVEEKDVTKPQISLETHDEKMNNVEEENKEANNSHNDETKQSAEIEVTGEVAESMPKAMMSNHHIHSDMFVELKDEDTVKLEIIVSGKVEHLEIEADVSKFEDFCLADTTEVKNWEKMVEEEEKNILTDGEEREAGSSKAEGTEAVEKDQGEQLDDANIETASENRDRTETEIEKTGGEMVVVITAAREKENQADDADALEDKWKIGGKQIGEIVVAKNRKEVEKELEYVQEKTAGEEEVAEGTEVEAGEEQDETELGKGKHFTETQKVSVERTNIQEESDEAGMEWEDRVKPEVENVEEENPGYREAILVDEMGESEILDAKSESVTIEDRENEVECLEERLDIIQNKVEDDLSARVNNVQEKGVIDKENTGEWENAHTLTGMHLYKEEDFQNNGNVTHDLSKAARDENESAAAEGSSCVFADGPESDQLSHDSASADSDSDDEVELYMHCLRAVHTGPQVHKDRNKDTGFNVGKRPSVSRSKLLSTPMPSISESLDEEQSLSCLQDNLEDTETVDIEPTFTALPASSRQESINRNVSWWIETFSCSNISKTLLYATLLVVFLVVAYHYDFLACFGLYLISLIWLCCHGERQTGKNNNRLG